MKCAGLKERCEWPEVSGLGPVVDKGKGKVKENEAATSPRGGEKRMKMKMTAKVVIDNDEVVEVVGPSGLRSGFNTGPFLERMDRLTVVVEAMTGQMAQIVDSTQSVLRSNDCLSAGLETFLEECRFFMAPWDKDEESEDSEAEVDLEEVSYPYFSQSQLRSNLGPPDLSLGIDATPDLVRPSPAP